MKKAISEWFARLQKFSKWSCYAFSSPKYLCLQGAAWLYSVDSRSSFLLGHIRNSTAMNSPRKSSSPSRNKRQASAFIRVQFSFVSCMSMRTERARTRKRARLSRPTATSWNQSCRFSPLARSNMGEVDDFLIRTFLFFYCFHFCSPFFNLGGLMFSVQYKDS